MQEENFEYECFGVLLILEKLSEAVMKRFKFFVKIPNRLRQAWSGLVDSIPLLLILAALVGCYYSITYFTANPFPTWKIDSTGEIGDTIGGLTGPVIGILNALLLYYTIIKQNKQINHQTTRESINRYLSYLEKSINRFKFAEKEGAGAIFDFFEKIYCDGHVTEHEELDDNPLYAEVTSILRLCRELLAMIETSKIPDKEAFYSLVDHQFRYRILPKIKTLGSNFRESRFCVSCECNHGLPGKFCDYLDEISEILQIQLPKPEISADIMTKIQA